MSGSVSGGKTKNSGLENVTGTSASTSRPVAPEGWEDAGADTPEWAYGAIVYTGPEAAEYTPSIVALVSKLTGTSSSLEDLPKLI